jgi:hypothetical protein
MESFTPLTLDMIKVVLDKIHENGEWISDDAEDPSDIAGAQLEMRRLVECDILSAAFPEKKVSMFSWDSSASERAMSEMNHQLRQEHVSYLSPECVALLDKYSKECHDHGIAAAANYDRVAGPLNAVNQRFLEFGIDSIFAQYETKLSDAGCKVLESKSDFLRGKTCALRHDCMKHVKKNLDEYLLYLTAEEVASNVVPLPSIPQEEMMSVLATCGYKMKVKGKKRSSSSTAEVAPVDLVKKSIKKSKK